MRLTDKRYHFEDTLAISGQVTSDRQFPTCSRAGRSDGSDGTVRAIQLETLDRDSHCVNSKTEVSTIEKLLLEDFSRIS